MHDDDTYRLAHRAPTADDGAARLDQLDSIVPDVYDRPDDHHGGEDSQTLAAIAAARGNPHALITVYRSMPTTHRDLNPGDWVSLSADYAAQSGMHADDPSQDLPVREFTVTAATLWWDANSLLEFGYDGPVTRAQ